MALSELRVFIAKSFADSDKPKVAPIEHFLSSFAKLGVHCETGEAAEAELISVKVRERIDQASVFVGIVSRRNPIATRSGFAGLKETFFQGWSRWSAPPWVLQEIGYALKGDKTIILFKEDGIDIGGLQSDLEYIPYDFKSPSPALTIATQMLNDAIAKNSGIAVKVSVLQNQPSLGLEEPSLASTADRQDTPPPEQTDPLREPFTNLFQAIHDHDLSKAEIAYNAGLEVIRSTTPDGFSEEDWNLFTFRNLPAGAKNPA
jgi:hypothetical protein